MALDRLEEKLMGTRMRLLLGERIAGEINTEEMAEKIIAFLRDYESRLSRFLPDSELHALNQDQRRRVPASDLLCDAVGAALWAAEFSGGLIDPTLLTRLRESGYGESMHGSERLPLADLVGQLQWRIGEADPDERWRQIEVEDGFISRPPGLEIDIGGSGKGLASDLIVPWLDGNFTEWVVNLGGDMRLGGELARLVEVVSPFDHSILDSFAVSRGGIATSGIDSRLWLKDGRVYHHLLDPKSGEPAFAGLVAVTAYASSALEAEVRAKMVLLLGPDSADEILPAGGVLVYPEGQTKRVGNLSKDGAKAVRISSN